MDISGQEKNGSAGLSQGQGLQEYGLILGLVVILGIGSVMALGQNTQASLNATNQEAFGNNNKLKQLTSLLSSPASSGSASNGSVPSSLQQFAFAGPSGKFQFKTNAQGYYGLSGSGNTTSAEGDTQALDFTHDALAMLQQLSETGKLPSGKALSDKEKEALASLANAGYGLAGAQIWLGGTPEQLKAAGINPDWDWASTGNNESYMAWAFSYKSDSEPDPFDPKMDAPLLNNMLGRYQSFKDTYTSLAPILANNPELKNMVNPIVGSIDQLSRNNFFLDPTNLGNNPTAISIAQKGLGAPLDIRGAATETPVETQQVSDSQAIQYTYDSSAQFDKSAGTSSFPSLDDLAKKYKPPS